MKPNPEGPATTPFVDATITERVRPKTPEVPQEGGLESGAEILDVQRSDRESSVAQDAGRINTIRKELKDEGGISLEKDIMKRVHQLHHRSAFLTTYMQKCLDNPSLVAQDEKNTASRYVEALAAGKNVQNQKNIDKTMELALFISTDGFETDPARFKKACESFSLYYDHLAEKEYVKLTGSAPSPIEKRFPKAKVTPAPAPTPTPISALGIGVPHTTETTEAQSDGKSSRRNLLSRWFGGKSKVSSEPIEEAPEDSSSTPETSSRRNFFGRVFGRGKKN